MLDNLEASMDREIELTLAEAESEKEGLLAKLQAMDADLSNKTRELAAETVKCNDLIEKVQRLERERQEIRVPRFLFHAI